MRNYSRTINKYCWCFRIRGLCDSQDVPRVDRAVDVNYVRYFDILGTIEYICTFDRVLKQVKIVSWTEHIRALLDEEIDGESFAEQIWPSR